MYKSARGFWHWPAWSSWCNSILLERKTISECCCKEILRNLLKKEREKKRKSSTTKELWIMSMGIFSVWQVSKCGVFSGPYFPIFGLNTEINGVNLCIQSEYGKIRTRKNSVFGQFCIYTIADMWKTVRVYFGKKLTMSGVASWIRRKISVNGSRFFKDKSMLDSTPENSDACENWSSMNECLAIVLV